MSISNEDKKLYTTEDLAQKLAQIRKNKKLSGYQIQLISEVNRTVIQRAEKGSKIQIDSLFKIIHALDMTPKEFFEDFD
jgi:transcriptional regulator with XRE-family HTH domain